MYYLFWPIVLPLLTDCINSFDQSYYLFWLIVLPFWPIVLPLFTNGKSIIFSLLYTLRNLFSFIILIICYCNIPLLKPHTILIHLLSRSPIFLSQTACFYEIGFPYLRSAWWRPLFDCTGKVKGVAFLKYVRCCHYTIVQVIYNMTE